MALVGFDLCNTLADVNGELVSRLGPRPASVYFHPALAEKPTYFRDQLDIFRDAKPLEGARQFVWQMVREGNGIVYISARPAEALAITREWLVIHGFPSGEVLFTKDKVSIIQSLGVRLMVEDAPFELDRLQCAGVPFLVPAWDYNAEYPNRICYTQSTLKKAGSF